MTPVIIAKWIFTAAVTLQPGVDVQLPQAMPVRAEGVLELVTMVAMAPPPDNCAPNCPPPPPKLRHFCIPAGAYSVTARIGLQPLEGGATGAEGRLWIRAQGAGEELLLATFFAAPGAWTADGGTGVLLSPGGCYSWRYDLTGPATINPDARVTYLAIYRVAE